MTVDEYLESKESIVVRTDSAETVAEIGEFALISRSVADRVHPESTLLGPGDDAAVVAAADGRVVATTDMLMQDRHFRLDWSSPHDIGCKAIAQNGADIAAMGARCTAFLVALACPPSTPVSVIDALTDGMWAEAERAGAGIVGGDVVSGDAMVISITALGDLGGRSPILRSGANAGDVVALCGSVGRSAAGLALLLADSRCYPDVIAAHRVPRPDYAAGPAAADFGATSMTDVSDGLLADLGHIGHASAVSIDVDSAALPVAPDIIGAAEELGVPVLDWLLRGGEDHALVATFAGSVPPGWQRIGTVRAGTPGVTVDGSVWEGAPGWTSF